MRLSLQLTKRARADVEAIYEWIAEHQEQPGNALRWLDGLQDAFESLSTHPGRCRVAPESRFLDYEVRQRLYHQHRILFVIQQRAVFVLHIRHGNRLEAGKEELGFG